MNASAASPQTPAIDLRADAAPVSMWRARLRTAWPYLVLVALPFIFYYKLAFTGMIMARGDVYAYFYPYWAVRSAALLNGQIPLWTPDIFMGVPLLANSQVGMFYPPNWLVAPLAVPDAITVSLLAHLVWMILGAYRLARRALGLDAVPAIAAAALFTLGGVVGAKSENINQLQALAWMPWLFLLFHGAMNASSRWAAVRQTLLLAVCIALQLLAGHPQTVFITLVGLGVYAVFYSVPTPHPPPQRIGEGESEAPKQGGRIDLPSRHQLRGWLLARGRALLMLAVAGALAAALASPQLVPMMELSGQSNRSGGLNPQQAMAFSLNPWVIGRGLLPSYDGLLFGEYIAYMGVIGMGLALVGLAHGKRRWPWVAVMVVGMAFALGLYNPLYWTLAGLPGFSFFRVPARWLALFALGGAMLAGTGLQSLTEDSRRPSALVLALIVAVVGGLAFATRLTTQMAVDVIGPALPTERSWLGWGVALVGLLTLLLITRFVGARRASLYTYQVKEFEGFDTQNPHPPAPSPLRREGEQGPDLSPSLRSGEGLGWGEWSYNGADGARHDVPLRESIPSTEAKPASPRRITRNHLVSLLTLTLLLELFAASRVLAYNELAPPDTYSAPRFTIDQLRAYNAGENPPGRVLSITQLQFDPGDVAALTARYHSLGMSDFAVRIGLVDTKMKETLAANLPLQWGIPSIDGFDGGLLPTGYYTAFTSLMLPPGELRTTDGRLREIMAHEDCRGACIPDARWLDLTDTRYLITDKVYDIWQDDVAYDTIFPVALQPGEATTLSGLPDFEADAVDLLYAAEADAPLPSVTATSTDNQQETLAAADTQSVESFSLQRFKSTIARTLRDIRIDAAAPITVRAITLVDTRTGAFQQLTPDAWKRLLSSDIKLYERGASATRALLIYDVMTKPNTWGGSEAALKAMADPGFNPAKTLILHTNDAFDTSAASPDAATIVNYAPERIEIRSNAARPAFLLLKDAYYPGWTATVNGQPAPIYRADVMFRAVRVPAGESTVVFEYRPWWWPGILVFGAVAWALALGALGIGGYSQRRQTQRI
jgi:hypothetical protein